MIEAAQSRAATVIGTGAGAGYNAETEKLEAHALSEFLTDFEHEIA